MFEKKLKSGRKVKIREISIDRIAELRDIPEVTVIGVGTEARRTIKNVNRAVLEWVREGLGGGDFDGWKPNGKKPPDSVIRQLSEAEMHELEVYIVEAQTVNPKKPSNSS